VGNIGVSPGSAVTNFPPGTDTGGAIHSNDSSAVQAHADLSTAYGVIAGEASIPANNLTGTDLGGLTLTPGVYKFNTSAQLTGALTLDAQGNPNARFDFQIGSTLTTASGATVTIINGGLADNVYFQVGSSATLGSNTAFEGNILADQSVTLNSGATLTQGRAMALIGAVTMDSNSVSATEADLSVTNTTPVGTLFAGNNITYSITVSNAGPNAAQNVALADVLPAGTTFVSDAQTSGPAFTLTNPNVGSAGTINGTISSLPANGSATFTVVALVPSSTASGTSITNSPSVTTDTVDPNLANNTQTVVKTVSTKADLSLVNTSGSGTVIAGSDISYSITVDNAGPSDAQTVALTDAIPTGTTFVSDTQTSGPAFTLTNPTVGGTGTISGSISTFVSNAAATFTVVVLVPSSTANGTSIINTPTVTTATTDPNLANDSQTVTTTVVTNANLSLSNTATPAPVAAGSEITYSIHLANTGPDAALTVVLNDAIPANTTFVSDTQVSGPAFAVTSPAAGGSGTVTGTISTLASGASATFSVVVLVPSTTPGGTSITDTASATTATVDPNPANNSQTVSSAVVVAPAITSAASAAFTIGAAGTFTVTTTGYPVSTLTSSTLTTGLTFVDNHNGTAKLSGTPAAGTSGVYTLNFTASNGVNPSAAQAFTLTVDTAPVGLTTLAVTAPADNVNQGATLQVTAAGTDGTGSPVALGTVVWSLDAGSLGSVDQNGLFTAGNSGGGTATIRATSGGKTAIDTITVNAINPIAHLTQVTAVRAINAGTSLTGFVVTFNGALDPTTAEDVAGYRILKRTTERRRRNFWEHLFGKNAGTETVYTPFKIASATYDAQSDSVTLSLASPMAMKTGVRVLEVMGTGLHAVLDANGKAIDGDANGKAGGNYVDRFSMTVAKSVTYQTTTGETVKLSLTGPGRIFSLLPLDTKTPVINLIGTVSADSILTGNIRKGRNALAHAVLDELNGTATFDDQLGNEFQVNTSNPTIAA
jgi:uncharacterized repeat protein (TIGR01451 family)